jgi:hypothetical protein
MPFYFAVLFTALADLTFLQTKKLQIKISQSYRDLGLHNRNHRSDTNVRIPRLHF